MNEFSRIVIAFGRGVIKVLISIVVGFGVGLLVIGIATADRPELWQQRDPPGEIFIGIGAGLLSGGGVLLLLFFVPWFFKRPAGPEYLEEQPIIARPAPRQMRRDPDDSAVPPPRVAPKARHDPDDSAPLVRPAPPPEEPGSGGFYEK